MERQTVTDIRVVEREADLEYFVNPDGETGGPAALASLGVERNPPGVVLPRGLGFVLVQMLLVQPIRSYPAAGYAFRFAGRHLVVELPGPSVGVNVDVGMEAPRHQSQRRQ